MRLARERLMREKKNKFNGIYKALTNESTQRWVTQIISIEVYILAKTKKKGFGTSEQRRQVKRRWPGK